MVRLARRIPDKNSPKISFVGRKGGTLIPNVQGLRRRDVAAVPHVDLVFGESSSRSGNLYLVGSLASATRAVAQLPGKLGCGIVDSQGSSQGIDEQFHGPWRGRCLTEGWPGYKTQRCAPNHSVHKHLSHAASQFTGNSDRPNESGFMRDQPASRQAKIRTPQMKQFTARKPYERQVAVVKANWEAEFDLRRMNASSRMRRRVDANAVASWRASRSQELHLCEKASPNTHSGSIWQNLKTPPSFSWLG